MIAPFLLTIALPPQKTDPAPYKACLARVEARHSSASLESMLAAAKAECARERDIARDFMRSAVATKTRVSAPDAMIEDMVDEATIRWLNSAGWARASRVAREKR